MTIITAGYPPAYLMGGPARSLGALTDILSDEFEFSVICSGFDDPAVGLMPGIEPDHWTQTDTACVWYVSTKRPSARMIHRLVDSSEPDVLYLNSLFSSRFSIFPLVASRLLDPERRVLLAPRGELSAGALEIRAMKKRLFLTAFRALRLHRFVTWHASTEMEAADIARVMFHDSRGPAASPGTPTIHVARPQRIETARDCSPIGLGKRTVRSVGDGESIVFFSRIVPKKNLHTLLGAIAEVSGDLKLTVAGPAEDGGYWSRCEEIIASLPDDKTVDYVGAIPGEQVVSFLEDFDLFVLPTLGENFGHVVLEALAAGLPVIVGRDTPWAVIEEAGAGWTCDPRDARALARRIMEFRSLSTMGKDQMRQSARRLAEELAHDPEIEAANRRLFRTATGNSAQ